MSEQDNGQVSTLQRPTNDDKDAWKIYWEAQGQPWRTEPEIDAERQKYLAQRRAIVPDIEQGIYPFKGIRLSRADVEWLLTTHESGLGPIHWSDEIERRRKGIDIRGANLRGVDLSYLPLARLYGGLGFKTRRIASEEQRNMAAVLMQETKLFSTHLENATLHDAHLACADLQNAYLEEADLRGAHLDGANLSFADLRGAHLRDAHLENVDLHDAHLDEVRLEATILINSHHIGPQTVDAQWGNANLSVVRWSQMRMLGDEHIARQKTFGGKRKDKTTQLKEYNAAVRANRQLAVALQAQGLNEDAARFAYRAQKFQRVVLWRQKKFGQYIFSGFLDLLAGYGYRPGRSVIWYLVTIFGFALAYFAIGHLPFFPDAFVFSLTSFHGRGFFPGLGSENSLHNPLVIMAAFEAVVGLLIEISFIATFTQRFFGR